ncbi:MAG: thiamine pyrophosphate-dependent enzyme [Hyphomicrobium sp.]
MPSGGKILIDCLAEHGVSRIFTVPGESFLAILDALHDDDRIVPIACRNESGAAMMAEATGKLEGRPGVALVTRGPGAANAFAGMYIAQQDTTPMLLFVGLPPRRMLGRDAFQAIDVESAFAGVAKWIAVARSTDDIPELVARAIQMAQTGRPGPVVIGLPEDVLFEEADVSVIVAEAPKPAAPTSEQISEITHALALATRPIVIVGGAAWSAEAGADLARFAENFDIPVAASFRRQDHVDNRHQCYAGHAGLGMDENLVAAFKISDVVIALGTRLGDVVSHNFTLFGADAAQRGLKLIHVAPDAERPDSAYPHAIQIAANPISAAHALAALEPPLAPTMWAHWRRDLRRAYVATLSPRRTAGRVRLEEIIKTLSDQLPDDAIIASGAGNYAAFLHRYFVYKSYPSQLAPISGSMGYGLPAAIAAKLAHPDRAVITLAGDGCFQMTGQELATAVQYGAGIVVIIANNGALGTIRMHQELRYPKRVIATSLVNPDFTALAASYGAIGRRVVDTADFASALEYAIAAASQTSRPVVIELMLDFDAISPLASLSEMSARLPASKPPEA